MKNRSNAIIVHYSNFQKFELCGKNAVSNSGCKQRDLLICEGTFANMVITVGSYCHDTTGKILVFSLNCSNADCILA